MFLQNMEDNNHLRKLRGRSAIQAAHEGIIGPDEERVDAMISDLYGVRIDEARDIHLNYHVNRILLDLARRGRQKGIEHSELAEGLQHLDLPSSAYQVTKGKLTETAAVDALMRAIEAIENPGMNDRYVNFYR